MDEPIRVSEGTTHDHDYNAGTRTRSLPSTPGIGGVVVRWVGVRPLVVLTRDSRPRQLRTW